MAARVVKLVGGVHLGSHFGRRGRSYGVRDGTIRKSDVICIVTIAQSLTFQPQLAISNDSDAQINWGGSLWAKFEEEEVDRCKPNFNMIWERNVAKETVSISSVV